MDKTKLKKLVESALDISYEGNMVLNELTVVPTQKWDEEKNEWIPDSYSLFLSIKDNRGRDEKPDFYFFATDDPSYKVSNLLETLFGYECCVDFV